MNSDRKKLSDIGTLVKPRPDSMTQYEPFVQMTLEERREFAARVWYRAVFFTVLKDDAYETEITVEQFMKDEGL
jgi:hypothetical protein